MSDVQPRLHRALLQAVDQLDLPLTVRQVEQLAAKAAAHFAPRPAPAPVLAVQDLTEQQLAVLLGIAAGERIRETAARLYVSEHTVRGHRRSLFRLLEVSTPGQAMLRASQLGLLRDGSALPLPGAAMSG
ncbi:response regulator transcription factor [Streptomyces sp. GTA36]